MCIRKCAQRALQHEGYAACGPARPRSVQLRSRRELADQPPKHDRLSQRRIDKDADQNPPIQPGIVHELVPAQAHNLAHQLYVFSLTKRIQLQNGSFQTLLRQVSDEGGRLAEIYNQVPVLAEPGT